MAVARERAGHGLRAGPGLSGGGGGGAGSAAARSARSQEVALGKDGARAEVTLRSHTCSSVVHAGPFGRVREVTSSFT